MIMAILSDAVINLVNVVIHHYDRTRKATSDDNIKKLADGSMKRYEALKRIEV